MYQTYTVKKGDSLYGISNQFGVSVLELTKLNNLKNTVLQIGQVLSIPNISGSNPSSEFIYTVKKGDSLYSIARVYNTSVSEIMRLNGLTSSALSIGQKLTIPETGESVETPPTYSPYVVKKGDTLYSIARSNNVSVDTLIRDNALQNTNLSIGQVLNIRTKKGESPITIEECYGEEYVPDSNDSIYTVKKGDNLYSIARLFNTDVSTIKKKNNLSSNLLSVGQHLKI